MKASTRATGLLKNFEGLRLKAYQDTKGIWTIGYGTTSQTGHPVVQGLEIDQATADRWFLEAADKTAQAILESVTVPLNSNQLDALTCLVYNIGIGAFKKSEVRRLLNLKRYQEAADHFLQWRMEAGKVSHGLEIRRAMERSLFLEPVQIEVASE